MAYITNEIKTVTGTSVSIPDSDQRQIVDLILQGDTYQKTTTQSNQLVNINSSSFSTQEINGVTITNNNDGSIKLNGRSTNEVALQISTEVNTPLTAGTYYLNPNKISGTGGMFTTALSGKNQYDSRETIGYSTGAEATITTNQSYTKTYVYIYIMPSQTFSNLVLKPILSKTSGASWEQYTEASPSPDYPQPINVVSGRQEVNIVGKNLINGTFRQGNVNGTVNNTNIFCDYNNIVVKNQQYTFSTNLDTSVYKYQIFVNNNRFPKSPSDFEEYTSGWKTTSSFTFTLTVDGYFGIGIQRIDGGNLTPNDIENVLFQLAKGTDTTYEAYKGQSYEINLGKNLLDTQYYENGSIDGSTGQNVSAPFNARGNNYIPVLPNTIYTFSANTTCYNLRLSEYTSSKTNIQRDVISTNSSITITTTANTYYVRWSLNYNNSTELTQEIISSLQLQLEKGGVQTVYTPYKTPIELCKIGTYQDRIYKDSGKWYIEKNIGKKTFTGTETWNKNNDNRYYCSQYGRTFKWNGSTDEYVLMSDIAIKPTNSTSTSEYKIYNNWNGNIFINHLDLSTSYTTSQWANATTGHYVYGVLTTPTYTEITDSELLSQLNALQLLEGLNNISISSDDLSSPLSITYYSTDNEYYDKIYSQDERNDLKIWFNDVELEDAAIKCEKITRTARILPDDGNKVFSLDNFISTNIEVILHNVDLEDIQDQVKISIGTLMDNNTYTYIPLGVFNIQDTPENDNGKITLKLRDNRVKFDFNYNGQELIEQQGGSATKRQILDDICEKAGVTNTIDYFENESDLIGIYDNTITGTTYVSYLMEQAGLIPTIDREGNLKAIDLSESYVWKIPLSILQTGFEIGEPYNIERVVYESGTIKYETSSDDTLNTLYLNILNPYITKNNQVEYILEKLHNFVIDSVTTKNVLGNPCIDPYDMIRVYNDLDQTNNIVFETLGNTTYTYNGTHRDIFDTQIGKEERKENVSLKGDATFQKYARTSIDNLDGKITSEVGIVGNNLDTLNKKLYGDTETQQVGDITRLETSITQKADSIEFNVYKETVDDILENGITKVQNTFVTINDEGLNVSTSNSKISTTMTNNEFKIIDNGGNKLAYFGYDETAQTSKAEIDNLTITTYLNTGVHRIEKYEEDGEEYTGFFYIGG